MFLPNDKSIDIIKRWFSTRSHWDETSTKTKNVFNRNENKKTDGGLFIKAEKHERCRLLTSYFAWRIRFRNHTLKQYIWIIEGGGCTGFLPISVFSSNSCTPKIHRKLKSPKKNYMHKFVVSQQWLHLNCWCFCAIWTTCFLDQIIF